MKKKIFYLNEDLEYTYEYVFYNQGIGACSHEKIANDQRDNKFKCINCFMIFSFVNQKQLDRFSSRVIKEHDFERAEIELKRRIKGKKLVNEYDK
ncbi:hypothetical protein [Spiroplasma floricola]|uniref:Uncharacterized protein n=1 Tax=Spiroplasma floricola 23-6 TaxID=1336749 RepID=A0A2K8SDY6_9MOLU|nr:hypothetical protein [Spiroplasma floricola]AUB31633.1 hypothetical protein SFLOR_v1c05810 [Spiroplasma floricola 23-6]